MFAGIKNDKIDENGEPVDVRPIGIGITFRKIVGIILKNHSAQFSATHFGDVQQALVSGGTEKIIHTFQLAVTQKSELCNYFMDGTNAFNSANSRIGLYECFKHFKSALPYLIAMYGSATQCWFYGLAEQITAIKSTEGYTQGDVMATWAYIMTIQPFVLGLNNIIGESGLVRFFVDDGNMCAPFDILMQAIAYVRTEGPKYGYIINTNKGSLLGSYDTAVQQKSELIDVHGLNESTIHIHPSDCDDDELRPALTLEYGAKVLGSFVGSNEYVLSKLKLHVDELQPYVEKLIAIENLQCRNLILRSCFCSKIDHLLRTIRPELTNSIVELFEG